MFLLYLFLSCQTRYWLERHIHICPNPTVSDRQALCIKVQFRHTKSRRAGQQKHHLELERAFIVNTRELEHMKTNSIINSYKFWKKKISYIKLKYYNLNLKSLISYFYHFKITISYLSLKNIWNHQNDIIWIGSFKKEKKKRKRNPHIMKFFSKVHTLWIYNVC